MIPYRLLYPGVPLYRAQENACALLALPNPTEAPETVTLEEAVRSETLGASFLYCDRPPSLSSEEDARALFQWIYDALANFERCERAVFWRGAAATYALGLDGSAGRTGSALELPLAREWRFRVARSARLAPTGNMLAFTDTAAAFSLVPAFTAVFSGGALLLAEGGVFCFDLSLKYPELLRALSPGFEYHYPASGEDGGFSSFSLLRPDGRGPDSLTFQARFDPCRPEARTLTFSALSDRGPMESCFRQVTGQPMGLLPALMEAGEACSGGLRFCPGDRRGPHPTEPMGDYMFPGGGSLLCGLLGTEAIEVPPGGRLRFLPGSPAWAPRFPARPLEIGDFVTGLPEAPLTGDASTAWVCMGQAGLAYRSQPDGAALFTGRGGLLEHDETGAVLPFPSPVFPMVPMAGLDSVPGCEAEQAAALEQQILAPVRQRILLGGTTPPVRMGRGDAVRTAATPSGQIVSLTENGAWAGLCLAQTAQDRLWLERPDGALTEAFRTGSLFLVAADPAHLGAFTGEAAPLGKSAFHNRLRLGDWDFTLPVGQGSRYNDYRCVMVVKGRDGALYDPEGNGGLIADPACWSCREGFSSPVVDGRRDPAQQTNLSNWLTGYFAASAARDDPYSAPFNALARDPAWRGILFLNVPIGKESLPEELAGLTLGLPEGEGLFLHHLGLRLSPVEPGERGPVPSGESAVFGLVRYEATGYGAPAAGSDDAPFRTLALRALFENSAVKRLESKAMLRLDRVLGMAPGGGSCAGSALIFSGGGQARDGGRTCALRCEGENRFCFPNGPMERVTVSSAALQTLDAATDRYRFELSGSMAFRVLETEDGTARDLFSFSALPFSGLALELSRGTDGRQSLSQRLEGVRLDAVHAQVRVGSLAEDLALTLEGMVSGSEERGPAGAGYTFLPLAGLRLSPAAAPPWHGLLCRAALGSLGELGDGVGISCKLLLAWDGAGAPSLWLGLPKLFEVERVLSLSVGDARMAYDDENGAYLLTLPEISLKCLGVLKLPPSGALSCCLFGGKGVVEKGLGWYAMYRNGRRGEGS